MIHKFDEFFILMVIFEIQTYILSIVLCILNQSVLN